MSDLLVFIAGCFVFAIATTATLMYGYSTFRQRAEDQGIGAAGNQVVREVPAEPRRLRQVV